MTSKRKGVVGRRARRDFSAEFKTEAVRMALARGAGVTMTQVGRELDVTADQLRAWIHAAQPEALGPAGPRPDESLEQEVRRLRREVAVLQQEQAFAKKVAVYFAKESQ